MCVPPTALPSLLFQALDEIFDLDSESEGSSDVDWDLDDSGSMNKPTMTSQFEEEEEEEDVREMTMDGAEGGARRGRVGGRVASVQCPQCNGSGVDWMRESDSACPLCRGLGRVPAARAGNRSAFRLSSSATSRGENL